MNHTKGPWRKGRCGSIVSDDTTSLRISGAIGDDAKKYYGGNLVCESISPENTDRAIECVNEFDGIGQPHFFMKDMKDLLEGALREMGGQDYFDEPKARIKAALKLFKEKS